MKTKALVTLISWQAALDLLESLTLRAQLVSFEKYEDDKNHLFPLVFDI